MQTDIQFELNGEQFLLFGYPPGAFVPIPNVGDHIQSGFNPSKALKITSRTFSYSNTGLVIILHVV
jgi:hypothetical protein